MFHIYLAIYDVDYVFVHQARFQGGRLRWYMEKFVEISSSNMMRLGQNGRHFADGIYFQVHFLEWKISDVNWYLIEICSLRSNWQCARIASDNGMTSNRRQPNIWTNDGPVYGRIHATPGLDELTLPLPAITVLFRGQFIPTQEHKMNYKH